MSNIQGTNPRPNGPDNTWKQIQKHLDGISKQKARVQSGFKSGATPLRSNPPIKLRSGGTQK